MTTTTVTTAEGVTLELAGISDLHGITIRAMGIVSAAVKDVDHRSAEASALHLLHMSLSQVSQLAYLVSQIHRESDAGQILVDDDEALELEATAGINAIISAVL